MESTLENSKIPAEGLPVEQSYMRHYLVQLPAGTLKESLEMHFQSIMDALGRLPESSADSAYAPGKWTVRQLVGHCIDAHQIFSYRANSIARGEKKSLPGFDENVYADYWLTHRPALSELAAAYTQAARNTLALVGLMSATSLAQQGMANGILLTAEQILRAMMGHENHHMRMLVKLYGIPEAMPGLTLAA